MADRLSKPKIFVETDYENIYVADPNKVVDSNGNIQDRLINPEELVMYADLSARIIPRTKLSIGSNFDEIRNLRIATLQDDKDFKFSMLNAKNKKFLDTSWTSHFSGDLNNTIIDEDGTRKTNNDEDTQLMGIQNITIDINPAFVPTVDITLVDIQGRALFEQGENSPYSAFMQLPYPLFDLKVKGYLGKAINYELMLSQFNSRYDPQTGNYIITLKFYARTYALLSDITLSNMETVDNMYLKNTTISGSDINITNNETLGYQKIKEVYSTYKSKGLIDEDFPEITISEMMYKLEMFDKYIMETYGEEDLRVLNDIRVYDNIIKAYRDSIYGNNPNSFRRKYISNTKKYTKNDYDTPILNRFKKELSLQDKEDALNELRAKIEEFNNKLLNNSTFGENGSYTVDGKEFKISIPTNIKLNDFIVELNNFNSIDYERSFILSNNVAPIDNQLQDFTLNSKTEFELSNKIFNAQDLSSSKNEFNDFIVFGDSVNGVLSQDTFLNKLNKIQEQLNIYKTEIEDKLTESLNRKVKSKETGLGFNPTIRNVMAVLSAGADAYLRLLDDVHTKAWDKRNNPIRTNSIVSDDKSDGVDYKNIVNSDDNIKIVYPFPEYYEEEIDSDGNKQMNLKYIGDSRFLNKTQGYRFDIWPEVEFVEEYIKSKLTREIKTSNISYNNESNNSNYIFSNVFEFPFNNPPFTNLGVVDFMYEIFERTKMLSEYSGIEPEIINRVLSDFEVGNIKNSAINSNDLLKILNNYSFDYNSFISFLRSMSNDGIGFKWLNLQQDKYNTNYLNGNQYSILDMVNVSSNSVSISRDENIENLNSYLNSNRINKIPKMLSYPINNLDYLRNNNNNDKNKTNINNVFKVNNTYNFSKSKKVITNYDETLDDNNLYITNIDWIDNEVENINEEINLNNLLDRDLLLTEGILNYSDYQGSVSEIQPTSMLNTPMFINSILEGVDNEISEEINPFKSLSFLYLNSLPLPNLLDNLKDINNGNLIDKDNIYASLRKLSAIHKVPEKWLLKIGSIYHRYKNYHKNDIDIIDDIWLDLDYKSLYSPDENIDRSYDIYVDGNIRNISLNTTNIDNSHILNLGIYPKLMNYTHKLIYDSFINDDYNEDSFLNQDIVAIEDRTNYNGFNTIKGYAVIINKGDETLLIPSLSIGNSVNISSKETNLDSEDILDDDAFFNGTSRVFWKASNYGYFNTKKITKPKYNEYFKDHSYNNKQSFDLKDGYTNIQDIFAVFDVEILDSLEEEYLKYSNRNGGIIEDLKNIFTVDRLSNDNDLDSLHAKQMNSINRHGKEIFFNSNKLLKISNVNNYDPFAFKIFTGETNFIDIRDGFDEVPLPENNSFSFLKNIHNEEYIALLTHVGEYDREDLDYNDPNSKIYNFFRNYNITFSKRNIELLSKIIKLYISKDENIDDNEFIDNINSIIVEKENKHENILNGVFNTLNGKLPNIEENSSETFRSRLDGNINKLELYQSFKKMNDKWISGQDFKEKTIFEDFLFIDRASRDVGDKIIVDINKLRGYINSSNQNATMYSIVGMILRDNGFSFMPTPSYTNFYGRNERVREGEPLPMDIANDLFGTHTIVDTNETRPRMVCFYVGKVSEFVNQKKNNNYGFNDDSFYLSKTEKNTNVENQTNKTNWSSTNKCVGFSANFGKPNQGVFKSLEIDMKQHKNTAATFQVLEDMGNIRSNQQVHQQTMSLYNYYKSMSYTSKINSLGNVMIQPTMYYDLRNTPIYNGTYMILSVNHTIAPGVFDTSFEGVRIPAYTMEFPDKLVSSINKQLLVSYDKRLNINN